MAVPRVDQEQSNKLFVAGLPLEATEEDLRTLFSHYGKVTECQVMMDRNTGASRGFGFVTFEVEQGAAIVLEHASELVIKGKKVILSIPCELKWVD